MMNTSRCSRIMMSIGERVVVAPFESVFSIRRRLFVTLRSGINKDMSGASAGGMRDAVCVLDNCDRYKETGVSPCTDEQSIQRECEGDMSARCVLFEKGEIGMGGMTTPEFRNCPGQLNRPGLPSHTGERDEPRQRLQRNGLA